MDHSEHRDFAGSNSVEDTVGKPIRLTGVQWRGSISQIMSIQVGQQLGSYEITSLLGKGGMGEVYRARDAKLKREVAIKILPDEFSRDPDRVFRFQREAEAVAALNHSNIAGIYDVQETNGVRFLVL